VEIRNILVPTDFSAHADVALGCAIDLAKHFSAKVHRLHAYFWNPAIGMPGALAMPPDIIETVRNSARAQLEPLEKRASDSGVACESHISAQVPTQAVIQMAEALPADLIVMGTRGLTGLKHVLLGSVAERTVRFSPCPVMTVKAD